MIFCKNKDIDGLIRKEVKGGAQFRNGRKHGKLRLANGQLVVISTSPSDHRAYQNVRATIRASKRYEEAPHWHTMPI